MIQKVAGATRTACPSICGLGTNRMQGDPNAGGRRWSRGQRIANLFVPHRPQITFCACENLTLTIVPLAIRQADHIAREMAAGTI